MMGVGPIVGVIGFGPMVGLDPMVGFLHKFKGFGPNLGLFPQVMVSKQFLPE